MKNKILFIIALVLTLSCILTFADAEKFSVLVKENVMIGGGSKITGDVVSVSGNIALSGGTSINGDVFVKNMSNIVKSNGTTITGQIHTGTVNYEFETVDYDIQAQKHAQKGNLSTTWSVSKHEITTSGHYSSINLVQNNKLYINTSSGDISLFVDNLNLDTGEIIITGSGAVHIYTTSGISSNSIRVNNTGSSSKFSIYVFGSNTISLSNDVVGKFSIYAPDSNISIKGSSSISGTIVAKNLTLSGSGKANYGPSNFVFPKEPEPTTEPETTTEPGSTNEPTTEPTTYIDEDSFDTIKKNDKLEIIINVVKSGRKNIGPGLKVYKDILENVSVKKENKSLERINKTFLIFSEDYRPVLKYGLALGKYK